MLERNHEGNAKQTQIKARVKQLRLELQKILTISCAKSNIYKTATDF
jgi:hypothetical protein